MHFEKNDKYVLQFFKYVIPYQPSEFIINFFKTILYGKEHYY